MEVTGRVGISVTGVVWAIVETGKLNTPCVVETFETDRLGLLSATVVVLSLMLSVEVRTVVCDTLGVNAIEIRVVLVNFVDVDVLTTKVGVSNGRDKFALKLEV